MTLDQFLDGAYCERVLRQPIPGAQMADFRAATTVDHELKLAAAARHGLLTDAICKRCFVSKTQRDVLAEILSP